MSFLRVGDAPRADATSSSSTPLGDASVGKTTPAKTEVHSDEGDDGGDQRTRDAHTTGVNVTHTGCMREASRSVHDRDRDRDDLVKAEDQTASARVLFEACGSARETIDTQVVKLDDEAASVRKTDTHAVDADVTEADRRESHSEHITYEGSEHTAAHTTPNRRKREREENDHISVSGHLGDQDNPEKKPNMHHTPADSKPGSPGGGTVVNQVLDPPGLKQEGTISTGNQEIERQMCASEMRMRELIARDKVKALQGRTPAKSAKDAGKKAKTVKSSPQGNIQSFFVKK
jgi:hypothetical protein